MADTDDTLPEPDRLPGAPHPREVTRLLGQASAEAEFLTAYRSGRMHSGWLLTGPPGVGKATLAYRIARVLLSEPAPNGLFGAPEPPRTLDIDPEHPDARLIRSGAHPRLFVVRRGANVSGTNLATVISVDQVRELKNFFHMSAADGGRRVVIVDTVDEMNRNAANALLKELEEPPARTTLLLLSHQPSGLLPTIRSRCRTLRLTALQPQQLTEALSDLGHVVDAPDALAVLSGGSVGGAIRLLHSDALAVYAGLVQLLSGIPRMDRTQAIRLADSCGGRAAEARFSLVLDLIDLLLSRAARAGLAGEPSAQGAPGEARLLMSLSPDDQAARRWADLQQTLSARARQGQAVNLDPAALILDMLFTIEATAAQLVAR